MTDNDEFARDFWTSLKSDMTVMLEADGVDARPMTAQLDGDSGPIYFFTSTDTEMAKGLKTAKRSRIAYASKGHDLFAHVHGTISIDNDRAVIDRLWNRFVAAWFEGGKDDPKLTLAAVRSGRCRDLERRLQPGRGRKDVPWHGRPEGGLQGQVRRGSAGLGRTPIQSADGPPLRGPFSRAHVPACRNASSAPLFLCPKTD